jgi:hypothetical protein
MTQATTHVLSILFFLIAILAIVLPITLTDLSSSSVTPTTTCTACNTCPTGFVPVCGSGVSVLNTLPILNNTTTSELIGSTIVITGGNTITTKGEVRFEETSGTDYVGFKPPAAIGSSVTWTLPPADGAAGEYLQTNGSGTLSWAAGGLGGNSFPDNLFYIFDDGNMASRIFFQADALIGNSRTFAAPNANGILPATAPGNNVMLGSLSYTTLELGGGINNTLIGVSAGSNITSGNDNIMLGSSAFTTLTSGSENIGIGSGVALASPVDVNSLVIGAYTTGAGSNTTVIGTNYVSPNKFSGSSTSCVMYYESKTGEVSYSSGTLILYVASTGNDTNTGLSPATAKLTLKGVLDAIPPVVGGKVIIEVLDNINLGTPGAGAYQFKALTSASLDTVDILIRGTGVPSINSGSATANNVLENTQANLSVTLENLTFTNGAATLRWYAGKLILSGTVTVNGWDSAITVSDSGVLNTVAGSTINLNGGNNGSASAGLRADVGGYALFSTSTVNFDYYAGVVGPTPKVLLAVEAKRFGNVIFDTCTTTFTNFQLALTTNPDKARLQVIGGSVTFNCDADVDRLINVSQYSHYAGSGATAYVINNLDAATTRPILLVGFMQLSDAYTVNFNAPYVGFESNFIILSEFGYLLDAHPSRTDPYKPYFDGKIDRNEIRGALLNTSGNDNRLVRKQSLSITAGVPFVLQEGAPPFNVQFIPESIKVFEQVGGGPGFTLIAHGGAYTPPYNLTFALGPAPTITVNSMISSGAICFVEYIPNTFNVGNFETQLLYYS